MSLHDLQRRLAAVPAAPAPRTAEQHSEAHRRRVAVARFEQERDRALADPDITPLKRARLTARDGAGMSLAALAILADVSRESIRAGEAGRELSPRVTAKLATALGVSPDDLKP